MSWERALNTVKHLRLMPSTMGNLKSYIATKFTTEQLVPVYQLYDKLTGLDQVRLAHQKVIEAEKAFSTQQIERRECQMKVFKFEEARNRLNSKLDTVNRSDPSFLKLVTELHEVSLKHKEAREQLTAIEYSEQLAFEHFSGTLRHSQAEERIQTNRMRQWTVACSLAAGLLGFGATWLRFHNLDNHTRAVAMDYDSQIPSETLAEISLIKEHLDKSLTTLQADLNAIRYSVDKLVESSALEEPQPLNPSVPDLKIPLTILSLSLIVLFYISSFR